MSKFGTIETKTISGGSQSIIGGTGIEVDGTTVHADIKADSGSIRREKIRTRIRSFQNTRFRIHIYTHASN